MFVFPNCVYVMTFNYVEQMCCKLCELISKCVHCIKTLKLISLLVCLVSFTLEVT